MSEASFAAALRRATRALEGGDELERPRLLSRGGVRPETIDLSSSALVNGMDVKAAEGYGVRFLRNGSNPGARLELSFAGNVATKFFAPGQVIRGGFDNMQVKRSPNSARIGNAELLIFNEPDCDLGEELLINSLGPMNLLGTANAEGAIPSTGWVTVPEDTLPTAAYASQVGAFDGTGWELLRVFVKATDVTTADIHFFYNPSWAATDWFCATSVDGPYSLQDVPVTGHDFRVFTVPWSGRGVGCPAVYNLLPGGLTGLDFVIQGIR